MNEDRIQACIGKIYDAAMDPGLWTPLLECLSDDLAGGAPVVLTIARQAGDPVAIPTYYLARSSPEYMKLYCERYASPHANPMVKLLPRLPVNTCFSDRSIMSDRELVRTGYYNDIVKPQGAHHSAYALIPFDLEHHAVFQFGRRSGMGPVDAHEIAVVNALLPHMRRALQIQRRLNLFEIERDAAHASLDLFPTGVVLLNRNGEVVFANRTAEAIFARQDGLGVQQNRLIAATPGQTAALGRLIGGAVETGGGRGLTAGGVLALLRPSMLRPLSVLVAPLPPHAPTFNTLHSCAAVFISDPEQTHDMPVGVLARLYGLTPAEARVAAAVVMCGSLPEAADRLGIAVTTARTHLQRVFDKTGTRRQAELVQMILRSPAGLHG